MIARKKYVKIPALQHILVISKVPLCRPWRTVSAWNISKWHCTLSLGFNEARFGQNESSTSWWTIGLSQRRFEEIDSVLTYERSDCNYRHRPRLPGKVDKIFIWMWMLDEQWLALQCFVRRLQWNDSSFRISNRHRCAALHNALFE